MAEPIGPGDMVIHDDGTTVRMVAEVRAPTRGRCEACGSVVVRALRMSSGWGDWKCPNHWRPISRRADFETILAQLKTPVPVPEHETA